MQKTTETSGRNEDGAILEMRPSPFEALPFRTAATRASGKPAIVADLASARRADMPGDERLMALSSVANGLQSILNDLDCGVVAVDAAGRVVAANPMAEELLGIDVELIRGLSYETVESRLNPPPPVTEAIARMEPPAPVRRLLADSAGGQRIVESSISLVRGREGEVIGAAHLVKDISPSEELERKQHHTETLAAIGKVAASLAHEVRNPLNAIEGFSRLLQKRLDPSDPCRRFADNIARAAGSLHQAVTATLILAQNPRLDLSETDPVEVLDEVRELIAHEVEAKGLNDIHLSVESGELSQEDGRSAPCLLADREQLKRAILNLCQNAVEAMPRGGRLTLRVSSPPIEEGGRPAIRLTVQDSGEGIPMEMRNRIFQPFETSKKDGTGLGLAIVDKVVRLHGGRIVFESVTGRGTAFHLDFPVAVAPGKSK